MNHGKDEKELAQERDDDAELEEDLTNVRGNHPEWADETAGDHAEGAGPEPAGE